MIFSIFSSRRIAFLPLILSCGLTLLLAVTLLADFNHGRESARNQAVATARSSAVETLLYRELFVAAGGAYLPVDNVLVPDPGLLQRPDRDFITPDGKTYTLVTPPRLLALVHGGEAREGRIQSAIKTFDPLGPADTPDEWERGALASLREGRPEVSEEVLLAGESFLRFMYPVRATEGCVKNRPGQQLKVGDLLGGVSIRLPMAAFEGVRRQHNRIALLVHGLLWFFGVLGIGWFARRMQQRDRAIRAAEQKASAAWRELHQMFQGSTIGMLKLSPTGEILMTNGAFAAFCGVAPGVVTGRSLWETLLLTRDATENIKAAIAEVVQGGLAAGCEIGVPGPGSRRFYQFTATPLGEDAAGKVAGVLASFHDITQRRQAEEETRVAKEELEKIFDAIKDVITVQDREMRIVKANRAAGTLFHCSPEALLGRYCYEVFRGAAWPCPGCPELDAFKDGKVHESEVEHKGLKKRFAVSASPLLDEKGGVARIVHCARDLTEKLNLEQQLRQAQKMEAIGTLAGGIAHDFNNILTAVIGFSELARANLPADSPVRDDLGQVVQAGLRAKELVRQILTFSRQAEQDVQPLRLQPIVKESLKLLRASIPASIELRQQIAEECGMVAADPTQVHQVVMNLCTNAYQAMREKGGVLGVTLEPLDLGPEDVANKIALKPGHYARFSVSDTGSGIAPEHLDRIFEPYFTTKKQGEGTGLGLSVVHGIVQGLGGHVSVYSEPGTGTTFHVYLPLLATPNGRRPAGAVVTAQIPTGRERVLVLDDEKGVVELEQRILESLGYTVRAFTVCTEALDEFRQHPDAYDLIITDMNMPRVSGAEVVETVRAVRPEIPVILCTGFSEIMNEEKAREMGINRLAMKPLTVKELAQAVREVLDQQKQEILP